jgi:hypothetical protein
MTDISTQEREAQLRKMERTVMEKVSMTNVAHTNAGSIPYDELGTQQQEAAESAYVPKEAVCIHCHAAIVQWRPRPGAFYVHAESGMHSCPKEFQPLPNFATTAD